MALTAKANMGGSFTPVPNGMHLARCYRIVDLGTQKTEHMGVPKLAYKVMLQFEVHSEDESGKPTVTNKGEPMSISKNYTMSLHEKATLRNHLKMWRGRDFTPEELGRNGFELKNVLGVWCMLSISQSTGNDGKTYTNIDAIMPVPAHLKKLGLPTPFNQIKMYEIEDHDSELFATFSDSLRAKIMGSMEYQRLPTNTPQATQSFAADLDDDIPF